MDLTYEDLKELAPKAKGSILDDIVYHQAVLEEHGIVQGPRRQMFLAQIAHESDGFRTTREYASGRAYEGRQDLGNTEEGDGIRFRGRGLIQLTGRANYKAFAHWSGVEVEDEPELLEEFPLALEAAVWYWDSRDLNTLADKGDFERITRKINGGLNGLEDRQRYLERAQDLGL